MAENERIQRLKRQIELETKQEREVRLAKASQDPDRPRYHFQPSRPGFMGDPNGPIFWKGNYHMFYQCVPDQPLGIKDVGWGHTVSEDLIHWKELPLALIPSPNGPDRDGCWSGSAVSEHGVVTILYTGVSYVEERRIYSQCIATSKDEMLINWEKYKDNPVIGHPLNCVHIGWHYSLSHGMVVTGPNDPCAWREGENWYMVIGSGINFVGAISLLYKSKDLIHWEYLHPLYLPDKDHMFHECPDFFPVGNRYVLITSRREPCPYISGYEIDSFIPPYRFMTGSHWEVGAYVEHKFIPEKHGMTDWGSYTAARTMMDDRGRRIMWGWVNEERSPEKQIEAGWSGALALPRILSLLPDNTLEIKPVPELEGLRGKHWNFRDLELVYGTDKSVVFLEGIQGDCIEVVVRFAPNRARKFGLIVKGTDKITYNREEQRIVGAPLVITPEEGLNLQVYVDRSIIEVFANDRVCKTLRTYHENRDNLGVGLFAKEGNVKVKSVDIWEIK